MKDKKMLTRTVFVGRNTMFQILNRELATITTSEYPYASISITNPDLEFAQLAESPNQKGILCLRFEDYPIADPDFEHFSLSHAEKILEFYARHQQGVTLFIINCEKGINRSAAVGAALSRIANGEDSWFFERFQLNRLVYDTLLAVHREHISR